MKCRKRLKKQVFFTLESRKLLRAGSYCCPQQPKAWLQRRHDSQSSPGQSVKGQEATITGCSKGNSHYIVKKRAFHSGSRQALAPPAQRRTTTSGDFQNSNGLGLPRIKLAFFIASHMVLRFRFFYQNSTNNTVMLQLLLNSTCTALRPSASHSASPVNRFREVQQRTTRQVIQTN